MVCAFMIPVFAQEPAVEAPEVPEVPEVPEISDKPEAPKAEVIPADTTNVMGRVEVIESPDQTRVALGRNEVIVVEETGDTVVVGLGSKGVSIVEEEDGVKINTFDMEEKKSTPCKKSHKKRFQPHWGGVELGLNNFLTHDYSMVLPQGQEYMDLNTGRSWNWNLNIVDFGVGLGTRYVGLVTGLGFEFINYHFDGQSSIMKDPGTGEIVEYIPSYAPNITKSKMNINYFTAPLLLEFQIPVGRSSDRIHISGGVIGGLKINSNTKIKYIEGGDKSKEKNKGDFNLSPLRWGVTASVGYGPVSLFAKYYMTPLFKEGMGPELYPFTVGIALVPND